MAVRVSLIAWRSRVQLRTRLDRRSGRRSAATFRKRSLRWSSVRSVDAAPPERQSWITVWHGRLELEAVWLMR